MDSTNTKPLTFLGIAGSLRRLSFNRGLFRAAMELAPPGISVRPYDYSDVPLYNGDVEAAGDPEPVIRFKRAIANADGLLIATPEYNHCVPGVLKNAIDWASRPPVASVLSGKRVAIIGATLGPGGTARAQAQLRDGLTYTNGYVLPLPEGLVPLARQRIDAESDLVDAETRSQVVDLLKAFAAWTRRLRRTAREEATAS